MTENRDEADMSILCSHLDIRRVAALALVLWLGGVACLVGCEMSASAATSAGAQVSQESESCSMSAGHACCHAQRNDGQKPRAGTSSQLNDSMTCCPLAGQPAAAVSKTRVADTLAIALTPDKALPAPASPASTGWLSGKTHVPDRGGTYLRCCVFLI
jgi:hypothetical protein